jgi:hypothetical protein
MRSPTILAALALAGAAHAQQFANGDFSSGDLSGWSLELTPNGVTNQQLVADFDIDGPGPLPTSSAAGFAVGNAVNMPGNQAGIELVQMLDLTAGVQYAISFNWAALCTAPMGANVEGGVFSVTAGGVTIPPTVSAGSTATGSIRYGFLQALYTPSASGLQRIGVRITRPFTATGTTVQQWIDNVDARPFEVAACCMPNGACTPLTQGDCATQGGVWRGTGTACNTFECPLPARGACCIAGACAQNTQSACLAAGGVYAGDNISCDLAPRCPLTLSTTLNESTITTPGAGVFLNLTPVNALRLVRLDFYSAAEAGNWTTIRLYTYPGDYTGHDADPAGWELRDSHLFQSGGAASPMRLLLTEPLQIEAGETRAFYIVADGGGLRLRGTAQAPSAGTFSDDNLAVYSERARGAPWGGTLLTGRSFSGVILYSPLPLPPQPCYPNCDDSTAEPRLNVLDFNCFLNRFGAGDTYANCDGSTAEPLLNVLDFNCFLNSFSTGCR